MGGARKQQRTVRTLMGLMFCVLLIQGCDDYPRDPRDTLEEVRNGTLRVGVLEDRPFAVAGNGEPRGVEPDLVRDYAESLDAEVRWKTGPATTLMAALRAHQLDLVLGGLDKHNPGPHGVALTRPYFRFHYVVAGPTGTGTGQNGDIAGKDVAVDAMSALAAKVAERGGRPVPPGSDTALSVKPSFALSPDETAIVKLQPSSIVAAVIRGENAWLMATDQFFRRNAPPTAEITAGQVQ